MRTNRALEGMSEVRLGACKRELVLTHSNADEWSPVGVRGVGASASAWVHCRDSRVRLLNFKRKTESSSIRLDIQGSVTASSGYVSEDGRQK